MQRYQHVGGSLHIKGLMRGCDIALGALPLFSHFLHGGKMLKVSPCFFLITFDHDTAYSV